MPAGEKLMSVTFTAVWREADEKETVGGEKENVGGEMRRVWVE